MMQQDGAIERTSSVNAPAQLAREASRPWQWSIASWGLILLGPLAAVAFLVTRPEPVVTPLRTMSRDALQRNIKQQTRDGRPMVRNLSVTPLPGNSGHRLTGERLPDRRSRETTPYSTFELVVPLGGTVWQEPPPEGLGGRALQAWIRGDEPRLLANGQPLELPTYLETVDVPFEMQAAADDSWQWVVPLLTGLAAGLSLAGVSRLVGGPREGGFGFGDLSKVKNPEPTKVDLAAIAAEQRAKAAELDSYLDTVVVAGGSEPEDADEPAEQTEGQTPTTPAKQPPRQLTQDAAPRYAPAAKADASYDGGEFYPTAVGSKRS